MELAIVVIMLLGLGGYFLIKALEPPAPPIDDMEQHLKTVQSLPNQKARQKYLKQRATQEQPFAPGTSGIMSKQICPNCGKEYIKELATQTCCFDCIAKQTETDNESADD